VAARAAARLVIGAEDRVAAIRIIVDDRHDLLHFRRRDHAAVEPGEAVGVRRALEGAQLMLRLAQHENAARGEHDVVVQVLREVLVEGAGQFINGDRGVLQVVGADDGGVAARIAATQPTLLDNRDIGHLVVLGEVIGGGEPVAAGANDDGVVFMLRIGRAPGPFPVLVVVHGVSRERKNRITRLHEGGFLVTVGGSNKPPTAL
jgi:hypothetical protein